MLAKDTALKAKVFLNQGMYQAAEKALTDAGHVLGANAELDQLLGLSYYCQSRFAEAIAVFERLLSIDKNAVEARVCLAMSLCDLGFYARGEELFKELEESTSRDLATRDLGRGYSELAKRLADRGLPEEATGLYEKARQSGAGPEDEIALAELYLRSERLEEAVELLTELAKRHNQAVIYRLLGRTHQRLGQKDRAKLYWEKALKLDPEDAESQLYFSIAKSWS